MSIYKNWPSWPKTLDTANWNKQKGIIAKVVKGETGVGAKLDSAEKAYRKIVAGYFHETCIETTSSAHLTEMIKKSTVEMAHVKAVKATMTDLSAFLKKQAATFKKSPLVPKASREHLDKMALDAERFGKTLYDHCVAGINDMTNALDKLRKAKA